MKTKTSFLLRPSVRLSLGLLLLLGLCFALETQLRPAHAQATNTLTVSDCTGENGPGQIGTVLSSASSGDTITFSCSGDIPLTSTLTISANLTLDGSGQNVTLDGQKQVRVLVVNSGVSLTLNALTIANGYGGNGGGGIYNVNGTVNLTNSTLSGNFTDNFGGAIFNANGTVSLTNSTLSSNQAHIDFGGGEGGGIYNDVGTLTITNSTLSGNSADGFGGAIENGYGTVSLTNSTLSGNSAASGGGGIENVMEPGSGKVTISGSIVAENSGGDCANNQGTVSDNGYNLDSDGSCFTASTSQHANPMLSALANNGGPTQTMALQQGSPAIDAIPLSANICPSTDQRGNSRPDDLSETACDMGAYESSYSSLSATGTNVSATEGAVFNGVVATGSYSGSGTLSASINWGDGSSASTGTVSLNGSNFSVSGSHTYAEEGKYSITVSVSDGQGPSASATDAGTVSDAALTLKQFAAVSLPRLTAALGALFSDADPAGTVSDYTATVTWGDGSASSVKVVKNPLGQGFVLAAAHRYATKGTYSVTLTVSDQGGSQLTKTVSVTVK